MVNGTGGMPDNSETRPPAERPAPVHLRVFLASPGDVPEERDLARTLIKERLPYHPLVEDLFTFNVISWDDPVSGTRCWGR
jgi:hypothetical protein